MGGIVFSAWTLCPWFYLPKAPYLQPVAALGGCNRDNWSPHGATWVYLRSITPQNEWVSKGICEARHPSRTAWCSAGRVSSGGKKKSPGDGVEEMLSEFDWRGRECISSPAVFVAEPVLLLLWGSAASALAVPDGLAQNCCMRSLDRWPWCDSPPSLPHCSLSFHIRFSLGGGINCPLPLLPVTSSHV